MECFGNGQYDGFQCCCFDCEHLSKCYAEGSEGEKFLSECLDEVLSSDMDDKEAYAERMEDLLDLIAHHRAMEEHKKNPVTYTSEDVEQMLAGDSNGDLKQTLTKTPR